MAKGRGVGLTGLFWRYLAVCGACVALIAALWWAALSQLLRAGVILPARTAAETAEELIMDAYETGTFDAQAAPHYVRWARFDRDGALLDGVMDEAHLRAARRALAGDSYTTVFPYTQYHRSTFLRDGSALVLQFDYAVPFASESLQASLPDFQAAALALLLGAWIAACALATHYWSRLLRRDACALMTAAQTVAARRLDTPLTERARVREMNAALGAIEELRASLSDSLKAQWAAEMRRKEELSALSHDLRTPLTAIMARADLLCEDAGDEAVRRSAQAIVTEAERLSAYAAALDGLWRDEEEEGAAREDVAVKALFDGWRSAGEALCAGKGVRLTPLCRATGTRRIDRAAVDRAALNLLDNAVRFTPPGGEVRLCAAEEDGMLTITVEDGGPGFSAEALRRAGYALYTGEEGGARGGHRGMGLCVARRVAERHGGALTLENLGPGGARASLTIRG